MAQPTLASGQGERQIVGRRVGWVWVVAAVALLGAAAFVSNPDRLLSVVAGAPAQGCPVAGAGTLDATVRDRLPVGGTPTTLTLRVACLDPQGRTRFDTVVYPPGAGVPLPVFEAGDGVQLTYEFPAAPATGMRVHRISPAGAPTTLLTRGATLVLVLAALLVAVLALLPRGFKTLCTGKDGRMSNSQTQVALWFLMVIAAFLTTVILRVAYGGLSYATGVSIPENLLMLTGLSALVFVGARALTEAQTHRDPASKAEQDPRSAGVADLFHDDAGKFELSDFQMMVVTLIAVLAYALALLGWLDEVRFAAHTTLPDASGTILALFGVGQGAYLGRKFITTQTVPDTPDAQGTIVPTPAPRDG
ncbi:hypothetical protein [Deinococcus planocerae]|uniref:hypothetical protein n=1 Tax=Deinococcus planocerae TaxID=1737569 RepID=UPI0011AF58A1|nr:hypothetical protein [Deinococcus planocerae]